MKQTTLIKFVKKAGMWCLTYYIFETKKEKQKQEWFHTLEEAKYKIKELEKKEK